MDRVSARPIGVRVPPRLLLLGAFSLRLCVYWANDFEVINELRILSKPASVYRKLVEIRHAAEVVMDKASEGAGKAKVAYGNTVLGGLKRLLEVHVVRIAPPPV